MEEMAMNNTNLSGRENISDVTKEQLMADFNLVISDAEALIKATANQGGEAVAALRTKADRSLAIAKARMADTEVSLRARAKLASRATDSYVHENTWQTIGVVAGLGLLVGFIMGQR